MLAHAVLVCLGLGLAQGRPSASAQAPQLQTTGFSSFDPNTGTYTVGTNTNLYQVAFSNIPSGQSSAREASCHSVIRSLGHSVTRLLSHLITWSLFLYFQRCD